MAKTLIISVAMNGHQWLYRPLTDSHEQYSKAQGYHYVHVCKPTLSILGIEVAWLKISLAISALKAGYNLVALLDADTRIAQQTPALESLMQHHKHIYVANGFSGRPNTGVLILRNSTQTIDFLEEMIRIALCPMPEESNVGWGENGQFIELAKDNPIIEIIDRRWNNNASPDFDDFIRHYSAGPMRRHYHPKLHHYVLYAIAHYSLAILRRVADYRTNDSVSDFHIRLKSLTERTILKYPQIEAG